MKALYFDGRLEMREIPEPEPAEGEALIRVAVAGICRTDMEIVKGYMGFAGVPGHEFVGVVESAPDAGLVGRRVVGEINIPEGWCEMCRRGRGRHCLDREVLGIFRRDGAFAEKLRLPVKNLFPVPDGLEDERAVFTEPVAACCEILEQLPGIAGERVLIVGDGRLASLAAQVLKGAGCGVTVAGKYEAKLELLKREYGIDAVLCGGPGGGTYDFVVECSGRPSGLEFAASRVKPGGTIVLKSTYGEKAAMDMVLWVINEITVVGSRCGPFAPALEALSEGRVNPLPLVEKIYSFDDALEAFDAARKPGAKKVLLKFP